MHGNQIGDLAKRSGCEVVTIRYYEGRATAEASAKRWQLPAVR